MPKSAPRRAHGNAPASAVRLLYLSAADEGDAAVSQQLAGLSNQLVVATASSLGEALAELRKSDSDYRALVISPALGENHVLTAIGAVRRQRVTVSILPVLRDQAQADVLVNGGASDVLAMNGDLLVNPLETIASVTNTPMLAAARNHAPRDRQQKHQTASGVVVAAKKASAGLRELFSPPALEDELPEPMGRQALEEHLNSIRAEADRIFGTTPEKPEPPQKTASEDIPEAVADTILLTPAPEPEPQPGPERVQADIFTRRRPPTQTFTRAELDEAVDSVRLELTQTIEQHAYERAAWEKTFQDLRNELDERDTRSESTALEAHNADRAAWEATRQQLEARLKQREHWVDRAEFDAALGKIAQEETHRARAKLDAALAEVQAFRTKIRDKLVTERAAWETTRQQLEAAVSAAQAEVKRANSLHVAELRVRTKELREAREARTKMEATLEDAQAVQQETSETLASERKASETARKQLEAALAEAQAAQHETSETLAAERTAWDTTRKQLEASLSAAQTDLKKTTAGHAADRAAHAKELHDLSGARTTLEGALAGVRAELAQAVEAHHSERTAGQAARDLLEARLKELQAVAAQARDSLERALAPPSAESPEAGDKRLKAHGPRGVASIPQDHQSA